MLFFFLILGQAGFGQKPNAYGLNIINSQAEYLQSVKTDSNNRLVEIKNFIPTIKLDIRYATANNFAGRQVYSEARAFARLPVVKALQAIQKELNNRGLGLKIFDAYRPYSVTVRFFDIASDKSFVASPKTGSRHNRGCAVDLTLVSLKTGHELKMPTPYDSFAPEASHDFNQLPKKVKANRELLKQIMLKHGFKLLPNEWWHYDFAAWKHYELMDIPFIEL